MNARARRRQPSSDPWGRLFLVALSIAFIIFGFVNKGAWIGVPALVLGFIAGILFAFHSRVRGLKIFDKVEMPIAADPPLNELPKKQSPLQLESADSRPSLDRIRRETRNPRTDRSRERGS